nr:unnamed protein product [Spirometra erinaceieuropaei]
MPALSSNTSRADPMFQSSDDRICRLHDRTCSNHFYHVGAHPHQRCFESSCHNVISHYHVHYLCHKYRGNDEHNDRNDQKAPDVPTTANAFTTITPTSSDVSSVPTRPHYGRTSTSHIGLAGHLRIHRTETGEAVSGTPTYTRRICLRCPRTSIRRMGLLSRMRIHDSGIHRDIDSPSIPCTSATPNPIIFHRPAHRGQQQQHYYHHHRNRSCSSGPILLTMSPHINLTHRPGRSSTRPPHGDW